MSKGFVYLVGAGPGDPGLLTQKGAAILQSAQVVVYDRLVGQGVLDLMPKTARLINVGKNAGNHPVPQEEISRILLREAQAGNRVVRLKGGDSFLFGRGGEELELLTEHGVAFEVVPGVPSPIAATAYAGIPITHRDFCSSVHFITGHKQKDGALDLDYEALVRLRGTLVFLMSVSSCGEIADGLLKAGMPADMPAAVIENGTRPYQRKFIAPLSDLAGVVRENEVVSPALIVVGEVCTLSDRFDWFSALPLKGLRILVTAQAGGAGRLKARLDALGADVAALPTIETRPLPFDLNRAKTAKLAAFTSPSGAEHFFQGLFAAGADARYFKAMTVAAVGVETAAALKRCGIIPDYMPEIYNGAALAQGLLDKGFLKSGDTAALFRAKLAEPQGAQILADAGINVLDIPVYETVSLPLTGIHPPDFDWITFTSASGVHSFEESCRAAGFGDFAALRALCIGETTAKAARALGMRVSVSPKATLDAMADYLKEVSEACL